MKLLFVCHRLPYPPNRGGKIRPFNMIKRLSERHQVIVASLAESEQELRDGMGLEKHCSGVLVESLPKPVRWRQAWMALPSDIPSSVAYFRSAALHQRVKNALRDGKIDGVWVHCAVMASYVDSFEDGFRILDYGDLDSGKWTDYAELRPFPVSLGYALEASKMRRYEREIAKRFHQCTVTTHRELMEFKSLGVEVPCSVIPNGVNANYFQMRESWEANSPVIVFLGRMDYYPNIDGILHFTRAILPLIRNKIPQTELRIIGSNPAKAIRNLAKQPGLVVTGHVPDVRPYLADASVAIAPLRIARGTQNKILECMATGLPVVATPEAAGGIQASDGKHLLIGKAATFAEHVLTLLQDPGLRRELALSAREQVEKAHSWAHSASLLETLVDQVASRYRRIDLPWSAVEVSSVDA